jgi:hypothetical protein
VRDRQTTIFTRRNILIAAVAAAALIAVLVTALTGLFAGGAPQAVNSAASPASSAGLPSGVAQAGKVPTKVPNEPALRHNVTISDCSKTEHGWKAAGRANNPTDKTITYALTVFFTTEQATVLKAADTHVTVEPGKTADWTITKDFATTPKTLCVLRGVGTK